MPSARHRATEPTSGWHWVACIPTAAFMPHAQATRTIGPVGFDHALLVADLDPGSPQLQ